jgi:hypothetical protein
VVNKRRSSFSLSPEKFQDWVLGDDDGNLPLILFSVRVEVNDISDFPLAVKIYAVLFNIILVIELYGIYMCGLLIMI